jgi:DNA-binding NarL/FixJ family response regulator
MQNFGVPLPMATIKILIVDDSKPVRANLKEMLETMEPAPLVREAETRIDAISIWKREQPEILILDMMLKDGSGLDVLRTIRMEDAFARIIVWTNHDDGALRNACMASGADFFFVKATEYSELLDTIGAISKTLVL